MKSTLLFQACAALCMTYAVPRVDAVPALSYEHSVTYAKMHADSFSTFWFAFRQAVMADDIDNVKRMCRFPFETRGPMDNDRVVKYNKNSFDKMFALFLDQDNGMGQRQTESESIRATETPDAQYVQKSSARVGDLQFKKIKGVWKCTFAYLNDETIEKLR